MDPLMHYPDYSWAHAQEVMQVILWKYICGIAFDMLPGTIFDLTLENKANLRDLKAATGL